MSDYSQHTGLATPEGGSGTFLGNIDFVGGSVGIDMSNQQYSLKSITFNGCGTGIVVSSALVAQGMQFENCGTAINATGALSLSVIDSTATIVGTVI